MLLRNHGQHTAARSVPEAFSLAYFLEEACRIQLEVMQSGGAMALLSDAIGERVAAQYENNVVPAGRAGMASAAAAVRPDGFGLSGIVFSGRFAPSPPPSLLSRYGLWSGRGILMALAV